MSGTGLRHSAFVYESDADFVETMAPFISAGLDEGSPVVAVTTRGNCARLSSELGPAAKDVSFIDRDSWYVRPARTIAAYEARLRDLVQGGAEAIRVVGEVQFGPTHVEWDDWTAYEAVSNLAFAEYPARIVCPYDARALPDKVLEDAWRTHPGSWARTSTTTRVTNRPRISSAACAHGPRSPWTSRIFRWAQNQ
jgi:hypothetical protein